MHWFDKLQSYFPEEEMKAKKHFEVLLKEKSHLYKKEEDDLFLTLYAEFPRFLFIDYLLVSKKARGQGLGTTLIHNFKQKQKPILIEVEPADEQNPDTIKRMRFYKREGFKIVPNIKYSLGSPYTGKKQPMKIMYLGKEEYTSQNIYSMMEKVYKEIYEYKNDAIYNVGFDPVEHVLQLV